MSGCAVFCINLFDHHVVLRHDEFVIEFRFRKLYRFFRLIVSKIFHCDCNLHGIKCNWETANRFVLYHNSEKVYLTFAEHCNLVEQVRKVILSIAERKLKSHLIRHLGFDYPHADHIELDQRLCNVRAAAISDVIESRIE